MIKNKTILAIIPARGRSKRIHKKNLKKIEGKSLIEISISSAKQSKYIDRIIISTDSIEIANTSEKCKACVPFLRPKSIAQDSSTSEQVIKHALKWLREHENIEYDFFILLQPTSPLRTAMDIDSALEKMNKKKESETLVSIAKTNISPYLTQTINKNGYLEPFIKRERKLLYGSQNHSAGYFPNGAIYIGKTKIFLKSNQLWTKKTTYYLMSQESSVDIDTASDLKLAEFLLRQKK